MAVNELKVENRCGMRTIVLALAFCSACGAPEPGGEAVVVEREPLLAFSPPQFSGNTIDLCFTQTTSSWPNLHADAKSVFDRIEESWGSVAKINFGPTVNLPDRFRTGCTGFDRITLYDANGIKVSSGGGSLNLDGSAIGRLSGGFHHVGHETGHLLGYSHENRRNDFVRPSDWVAIDPDCNVVNTVAPNTNTAADPDSVLVPAQCRPGHPVSFWDVVGVQEHYGARVSPIFPLVSWSKGGVRATASAGTAAARFKPGGHKPAFAEGWIWTYSQPPPYGNPPGTQPVTLYENASTLNYALAVSSSTQSELTAAGFTSLGPIGAVYTAQDAGGCAVPLNTYKLSTVTPARYATLANPDSQNKAVSEGYVLVRTEGYVFTPIARSTTGYSFPTSVPYRVLAKYIKTIGSTKQDWATVPIGHVTIDELNSKGYNFVQFSGAILNCAMPGTVPLYIYYSSGRDEYYTTTASTPPLGGYALKGTAGYVFSGFVSPSVTRNLVLRQYTGSASFFDFDLDSTYAFPAGLTQLTPYTFVSSPAFAIPVTSTGYGN
jgi:hypothetical protein